MDPDTIKLLGSGGLVGALLALIYIVGMRLVAALDRVGVKVDDHTKADGELTKVVVRLEEKIDGIVEWHDRTPVEIPPSESRPTPRPIGGGEYSYPIKRR